MNRTSAKKKTPPTPMLLSVGGAFPMWLVRDSNPRRLSQLIYSQFPLATWVTSQMRFLCRRGKQYPTLAKSSSEKKVLCLALAK